MKASPNGALSLQRRFLALPRLESVFGQCPRHFCYRLNADIVGLHQSCRPALICHIDPEQKFGHGHDGCQKGLSNQGFRLLEWHRDIDTGSMVGDDI